VQDACAARLRDAFIEDPNPKRALPCRPDKAPNFTAAWDRVRKNRALGRFEAIAPGSDRAGPTG